RILHGCTGRVIVAGMGKSGHVADKIASTLSSTGTPAFFLHPGEAAHGDLGMVISGDVVLAVSNSGRTRELLDIVPNIKKLGARLVALVGTPDSPLAREAEVALDASVEREACPLNLAPTSSTTAALALGDALAVALMELRQFKADDFARFHPGGLLGDRLLLLTVDEVLITGARFPCVGVGADFAKVVGELADKRQGVTAVVTAEGRLAGVISNGDVLRVLAQKRDTARLSAEAMMNRDPKTIPPGTSAENAVAVMETHNITALVVVDGERRPLGLVHLHDLLGRKTFWQQSEG
ncbi:MAG: arabinose-5-phosphate isomerase, partial [Candidatus Coatesbacteria bacterium RBG_13_66_14]